MPGQAGRNFVVAKDGTPLAGVRSNNMTKNGTPISDDDANANGFTSFIPGLMVDQTLEFGVEGVVKSEILRDIAMSTLVDSPAFFDDLTFTTPSGAVISGDFVMTAYSEGAPYKESVTFSATFTSNGAWTFAAATP